MFQKYICHGVNRKEKQSVYIDVEFFKLINDVCYVFCN